MSSDIHSIKEYIKFQKELGFNFLNIEPKDRKTFLKAVHNVLNPPETKQMDNTNNLANEPQAVIQNTPQTISPNWRESSTIPELREAIQNCKECKLGETRNEFVFGEGNPNADILIIGEAPGRDEDKQGMPFVGRAGQLLTKILEAVDIKREEVFIANICKCRPPGNRRPEKGEIEICEQYLYKQIELINPQFIISLGLTSIDTLLKKKHKMAEIRGQFMEFQGRKLMVTYHPAALLRNPNWKRAVWEDMKNFRNEYNNYLNNK
jgi:DNA polymerase